jgi:hypothetical protein
MDIEALKPEWAKARKAYTESQMAYEVACTRCRAAAAAIDAVDPDWFKNPERRQRESNHG